MLYTAPVSGQVLDVAVPVIVGGISVQLTVNVVEGGTKISIIIPELRVAMLLSSAIVNLRNLGTIKMCVGSFTGVRPALTGHIPQPVGTLLQHRVLLRESWPLAKQHPDQDGKNARHRPHVST